MTINYQQQNPHWNYFVALERDFEVVTRYVEPCTQNESVYSLELARLLMAATQEIDVVMQALCRSLDATANPSNINEYLPIVSANIPDFVTEYVRLPRFGMESRPWAQWANDSPPTWWTSNNKIKHDRSNEFHRATLKSTYNSISALLLSIAYLMKNELQPDPNLGNDWYRVTAPLNPPSGLFKLRPEYYLIPGISGATKYLMPNR